ncbi:Phenazine biosynthesis-like protein [Carex littledalei]|uniref:Phenazine biosynthesis-like protein n=1 Tax=Carex littledalei TaxID=544730 RepID=A0A833VPU6_9POAL|nr:Phenazine biosynthesis-like protein [Carex littledalei]
MESTGANNKRSKESNAKSLVGFGSDKKKWQRDEDLDYFDLDLDIFRCLLNCLNELSNAFSGEVLQGNPVACLLEENAEMEKNWMLLVAKKFNTSVVAFLSRHVFNSHDVKSNDDDVPRFCIWWFTPTVEVLSENQYPIAYLMFSSSPRFASRYEDFSHFFLPNLLICEAA